MKNTEHKWFKTLRLGLFETIAIQVGNINGQFCMGLSSMMIRDKDNRALCWFMPISENFKEYWREFLKNERDY